MLQVIPVEPNELPEGHDWLFMESPDSRLYVLLNRHASGESIVRGWCVAQGLMKECAERRRALPEQRRMPTKELVLRPRSELAEN